MTSSLKIGYVPHSRNLDHPADRRRFPYYARTRGLNFEIFRRDVDYDLIVVTAGGDPTSWLRAPVGKAKMIFELVDSYVVPSPPTPKDRLRGPAKFVTRDTKHFVMDYRLALRNMCRRADVVVCSTESQRASLLDCSSNTHVVLDIHDEVAVTQKTDYALGDTVNLVWEGRPQNLHPFRQIAPIVRKLQGRFRIALHVITDLTYGKYLNRFPVQHTEDVLRPLFDDYYVYQWNKTTAPHLMAACDIGIIPLNPSDALSWGKPENKLLLMWRLALPVITSATPAYSHAMKEAGQDLTCSTADDWERALLRLIEDRQLRMDSGLGGCRYTTAKHSTEAILAEWDAVLRSIGLVLTQ